MPGSVPTYYLLVITPFGGYSQGQPITDPDVMLAVLTGPNASKVQIIGQVGGVSPPGGTSPPPTIIPIGASVGNTPLPSGTALGMLPVNPIRKDWSFMNTSAARLTLVFDDGQGGSARAKPYESGGAAGYQGSADGDSSFKGRIQVFGLAGSTFFLAENI